MKVKRFSNYQWVKGLPMTERDKKEVGSKFWNKGKWDNYVLPFIKEDVSEMTLVDMGCNVGIFSKLAEDMGFYRVVGVEPNKEAFERALKYREMNGGKYEIHRWRMQSCLHKLPVADYTILANVHYYLSIRLWLEYLDEVKAKTRYLIVVTADRRIRKRKPQADIKAIREYFYDWEEVGLIDDVPMEGDPFPRKLYGICFKSPTIKRESFDVIDNGNKQQVGFYGEVDEGKGLTETAYYERMRRYRGDKWGPEKLLGYIRSKKEVYEDIKERGLFVPIVVNSKNRVADGNHRGAIIKHLGHKTIFTRRVP